MNKKNPKKMLKAAFGALRRMLGLEPMADDINPFLAPGRVYITTGKNVSASEAIDDIVPDDMVAFLEDEEVWNECITYTFWLEKK